MDRKNINRGFKKLRVWQDAVSLYVLACKKFANFPFELKKVAGNSIEAAVGCLFGNWNQIKKGQPLVWECHDCHEGVVIAGTYKSIHGEIVKIDLQNLDPNTDVMRF